MKYTIEQFPKNKDIDVNDLTGHQVFVRNKQKKKKCKTKTCSKCHKKLPIEEYYFKDKEASRRCSYCRDCQMKEADVIEIGKYRFAKEILKKGFRRCSVCLEIKPLSSYTKSRTCFGGYSHNCYDCSNKLHSKFMQNQKNNIGDYYVRQYGLRNGITEFNNEIINQLRNEIIESRKPKYFLNGKEFLTVTDFARYVKRKYDIPITTTEKRMYEGACESECIIKASNYRSLKSGTNKGKIKVSDTVTGDVFIFFNTKDTELLKMFGSTTIINGLKSGLPIGGKRSRYINPCIIERLPNK